MFERFRSGVAAVLFCALSLGMFGGIAIAGLANLGGVGCH